MPLRDVIGHGRLTALISHAIARETLPPTLLFAGPPGVGKWLVARAAAQTLNCLEPVTRAKSDSKSQGEIGLPVDACGKCRACDRIARGVHVDVIALEPDDRASIKIDTVREALEQTGFRPFEGRRRVVLVREADTLEPQAQNSLLKSLEEPPPSTVFILTTAVPGALLPTVRSRCMRLRFGRLTSADVVRALVRDHDHTETAAGEIAPAADGSIGQALAMADSDMSELRDTAFRVLEQTARADTPTRLQAATSLSSGSSKKERTREDLAIVLRLLASMLRDMEALNAGADLRVLANPLLTDDLSSMAKTYAGDRARTAFSAVDSALAALERNAGIKVVSEWLAVQL